MRSAYSNGMLSWSFPKSLTMSTRHKFYFNRVKSASIMINQTKRWSFTAIWKWPDEWCSHQTFGRKKIFKKYRIFWYSYLVIDWWHSRKPLFHIQVDPKQQLKNVQNVRIVRYKYTPEYCQYAGIDPESVTTGTSKMTYWMFLELMVFSVSRCSRTRIS